MKTKDEYAPWWFQDNLVQSVCLNSALVVYVLPEKNQAINHYINLSRGAYPGYSLINPRHRQLNRKSNTNTNNIEGQNQRGEI